MLLFHLKRTNNVYADVCSIYCGPSTMFAYVIVFCLMICGTPLWVSGPTVPWNMCWGKSGISDVPIGAQVIICHMIWQFLMERLWFKNTSIDPGRPWQTLSSHSALPFCLVFRLQIPSFTPTDIHTTPALVIVNCSEFFQMCTDTCTLHVG